MATVRAAVSRNLCLAHDFAARKLEDRYRATEAVMAQYRTSAARANGSPFAPANCIAAEYLLEDLRHELILLRKRITIHRERQKALSNAPCPVCERSQMRHCSTCGGCEVGDLTCVSLNCDTLPAKIPVSV
jgi:hypothetical protein